ncbi:hypothetical protein [Agarilytica rhodophyticola]|uniref:hypothetical protein n=1 Tax=Agarilytica rhodophyticola TaxID=1737490 RepID=UPI000B342985|nr:hypothetical protein [Agarilytica rhodophyticola]
MKKSSKVITKKLWVAIRFTHFPLESLGFNKDNDNVIVSDKNIICALTDNMRAMGLSLGMPSSTGQLLFNTSSNKICRIYKRKMDSENNALETVCRQLYHYTPHIEHYSVATPSGYSDIGILLELSSCIQLFKGLTPLLGNIKRVLKSCRFSYRYSIGHTKNTAWLLSYSDTPLEDHTISVLSKEYFLKKLALLDIDYLYEYSDSVEALKKSGFFTFADIIHHINTSSLYSLRKRFGENFANSLAKTFDIETQFDQAQLFSETPISYLPEQEFSESTQFDYPVSNTEQLIYPIKFLLNQLKEELINKQREIQSICWCFYDIHENQKELVVHFDRFHSDISMPLQLTLIQLENQALPFEVDTLELSCKYMLPVNLKSQILSIEKNNNAEKDKEKTLVSTKINARLGNNKVFELSEKNSHIPELSFKKNYMNNKTMTQPLQKNPEILNRPSWIFNIPIKIGKRQNTLFWKGKLELLQGPERIEGLWWKKPTARDYFVAKRNDNVRLWVFHDVHKDEWFVHGIFA